MHATTSPKLINQQPAALIALATVTLAVGIALGAAMDLDLRIPTAASVAAPDTSYNAVEKTRAQFGVAPDTSYDSVEKLRAQSGVTVNTGFDVLHAARAKAAAAKAASETSLFGRSGRLSSKTHDELRGAGGWWAYPPATVSQPEPNDRYGAGIR
jgi:hypothetical protein